MKNAKVILFILIVCLVVTVCLSCSANNNTNQNSNDPVQNNQADDNSGEIPETTVEKITYEVPDLDCGGYTFTSVVREGAVYWKSVDMYAGEENGEPINDAVYKRNRFLEDKFNINIQEIRRDDILSYVDRIIKSGSNDFDVMYPQSQQAAALVQRGLIHNLHDVPHLNFEKPWWDKVSNDSMTIGKKLYFAIGDINVMAKDATWAILFNKDLNKNYGLEDPYKQVKEGTWTLDAFHANCRAVTLDLDGDGVLTPKDQWGAVNQHECAYCLFAASGQRIVEKDADDLPVLALNNDRTVSVLTRVVEFLADATAQIKADDYYGVYDDVWTVVNVGTFNEGRALYYISPIETVKFMRNMEANFGILPLPKYNKEQEQYYSTMQYNNATTMCIPISASDLERTGAILEAWAAESVDTLTRAYYEINLKGKYSRDDESAEMLDLIFSTRFIDQGMLFNWSGVQDFFQGFSQRKSVDFTSQYERAEPRWIKAMEKTIAAIEENN